MLRREFRDLMMPERRHEVQPHQLGVAVMRLWSNRGLHGVFKPTIEERADSLPAGAKVEASIEITQRRPELVLGLSARLAVQALLVRSPGATSARTGWGLSLCQRGGAERGRWRRYQAVPSRRLSPR